MYQKFRTYDIKNDRMIYYTLGELIAVNLSHEYVYRYISNPNNIEDLMVAIDSNESTLTQMQCTGKQDTNGKDIYEDDIIYKETGSSDDPTFGFYGAVGVVKESSRDMGWFVDPIDKHDQAFYDRSGINFFFSTVKIIGNIHENPEMIA